MRKNTEPSCRCFPLSTVLTCLPLVVGAAAMPASAESPDGVPCPPNLQCSPRAGVLLAQGVEQSEGLRSLVAVLSSHADVRLVLKMDRQLPNMRAHSALSVRFIYRKENGAKHRQVTGISGEVRIPYVAYAHQQIGLIAHELTHVMQLLRGDPSARTRKAEREANEIEAMVLSDLDTVRAAQRESRRLVAERSGESERSSVMADVN
jgi:hypothetical protein